MGTNYYARHTVPTYMGPYEEELHIGKSSGGWCFSLHVYPERYIVNLSDWQGTLYSEDDWSIYDEYRKQYSLEYLMNVITNRSCSEPVQQCFENAKACGIYPEHYTYEQFLGPHAEEGPNNLLRHKVDGKHCIGHGSGTWDLLVGDFS